jgi:hypothetical protein
MKELPELSIDQHPILFGRLFGLKLLFAKSKSNKSKVINKMKIRLELQPQFTTELLYEPAVQALVVGNIELDTLILVNQNQINHIQFLYHFSQLGIHKIFLVREFILTKQFNKARNTLENIEFGHIRYGYTELLAIYVTFFRLEIAKGLNEDTSSAKKEFEICRSKIDYPLLDEVYFENYFNK